MPLELAWEVPGSTAKAFSCYDAEMEEGSTAVALRLPKAVAL